MTSMSEPQEYRNQFWCREHLLQVVGILILLMTGVYILVLEIPRTAWGIGSGFGLILGACLLTLLSSRFSKMRVIITDSKLTLKTPTKSVVTSWKDIRRIEEVWGFYSGDRSYLVRTPQGTIGIPDSIECCEELLAIIQERSGKRIVSEWRGAKESLYEEWHDFLRWVRTHPLELLTILLIIGGTAYAATRWVIRERQLYRAMPGISLRTGDLSSPRRDDPSS